MARAGRQLQKLIEKLRQAGGIASRLYKTGLAWLLSEWGRSFTALGIFYVFLWLHSTLGLFAFTVGTTFATSDIKVTRRALRRVVLGHTVLSFAYNTIILALTVNLILR